MGLAMRALEYLREGRLNEALAELQKAARADPAQAGHRVFLFQLLAVLGQWERALNQLRVAGELDAGTLAMVQTYREAIRSESLRARVFQGRNSPLVFGEPPQWLALLVEALRLAAEGRPAEAADLRQQALDLAPAVSGQLDGRPFAWLADADARLGPTLEAIVNGRYYWIPFERIGRIDLDPPADLRDVVWMPAHFTWANGGDAVGLIPTRYPGTEAQGDDRLRLARRTEWVETPAGEYTGLGQRVFATDRDEYALMDIRALSFDPA
jgi:type VI secretion system protein ImpE